LGRLVASIVSITPPLIDGRYVPGAAVNSCTRAGPPPSSGWRVTVYEVRDLLKTSHTP